MDDRQALQDLISGIRPLDRHAEESAWRRLDSLTKPPRSLGRLEELAARVAAIQGTDRPTVANRVILLMAGDHGVVSEGVSAYPQAVTVQMVTNFSRGGAAINQLARAVDAELQVFDVGVAGDTSGLEGVVQRKVAPGTRNLKTTAAMTMEETLLAVLEGAAAAAGAVDRGVTLIGTGEMGIGNTTSASALTAAYTGADIDTVIGPGTGLDVEGVARKRDVVRQALLRTQTRDADPLAVLASLGGLEIAALAGVMLGGAARGTAVVVDGFIAGAAALAATALCPAARDYLLASHRSLEPGHRVQLDHLGMQPVLELDLRLGEGTGAALAMSLIDAACEMLSGMATFEEAGVSGVDAG